MMAACEGGRRGDWDDADAAAQGGPSAKNVEARVAPTFKKMTEAARLGGFPGGGG